MYYVLFKLSVLLELYFVILQQKLYKINDLVTISQIYEQYHHYCLGLGVIQGILFYLGFKNTLSKKLLFTCIISLFIIKLFTCNQNRKLHFMGLGLYLLALNYILLFIKKDLFVLIISCLLILLLIIDYNKYVSISEYILILTYCLRI